MLLSWATWRRTLEALGFFTVVFQIADWFDLVPVEFRRPWLMWVVLVLAFAWGLTARFPVRSIRYKPTKKDYSIEVRIGDIFEAPENIVISSNTTFDTDVSKGLISKQSLQGQFTEKVLNGDVSELDRQITAALKGVLYDDASSPGKKRRYPIGTVVPVNFGGKQYFFLAMAELNTKGNAETTPRWLDEALHGLWEGIASMGELGAIAVPVIGSGRGRLKMSRQKIIETIAQSFANASADKKIANRLSIILTDQDAHEYGANLFQVKDYLVQSLQP